MTDRTQNAESHAGVVTGVANEAVDRIENVKKPVGSKPMQAQRSLTVQPSPALFLGAPSRRRVEAAVIAAITVLSGRWCVCLDGLRGMSWTVLPDCHFRDANPMIRDIGGRTGVDGVLVVDAIA